MFISLRSKPIISTVVVEFETISSSATLALKSLVKERVMQIPEWSWTGAVLGAKVFLDSEYNHIR